ncbi:MAG TPA: undecaprenyldiphospho-muramoylpentapeptide beta-N-acetylglucosaminyltransferase [bacterium]|nr:undecaprenyldiphospho-muramoylpentapeptide beta-N-acetylglucosaminyltransferase [bacterium]
MAKPDLQPVVVFAGGGTGGHLFPALAIARALLQRRPNATIHFVGTSKGIETRLIPQAGFPLHLIAVRGFVRRSLFANLSVIFRLFVSLVQSYRLLRRLKPALVVGTGGYVSGPVLYMASLLRISTVIQEQNRYPGVATRWLSARADQVHIAFAEAEEYFKNKDRVHLSGNPIRSLETDLSPAQARRHFDLAADKPTILVFGGSQGARIINRSLLQIIPNLLAESTAQLIWSTGTLDYEEVFSTCEQYSGRIAVRPFIDEMAIAYAAADLALCRAGALTLAEITACGIAAVLIPFRYAAENHQEHNARALVNLGAARMLTETELSGDRLFAVLQELLHNENELAKMRQAARSAAFPRATDAIVDSLLPLIDRSV